MKKTILILITLLAIQLFTKAQENLTYQKPSAEILALADYERAPYCNYGLKKGIYVIELPRHIQIT